MSNDPKVCTSPEHRCPYHASGGPETIACGGDVYTGFGAKLVEAPAAETTKRATVTDLIRHLSRALGRATMASPRDERAVNDLRAALAMADEIAEGASVPETQ